MDSKTPSAARVTACICEAWHSLRCRSREIRDKHSIISWNDAFASNSTSRITWSLELLARAQIHATTLLKTRQRYIYRRTLTFRSTCPTSSSWARKSKPLSRRCACKTSLYLVYTGSEANQQSKPMTCRSRQLQAKKSKLETCCKLGSFPCTSQSATELRPSQAFEDSRWLTRQVNAVAKGSACTQGAQTN